MDTRSLGSLQVPVVGLGCNNFGMRIDTAETRAVVDAALEVGVTYFDTAEAYGGGESEVMLGAALKGRRDEAIIATKWGHTNSMADGERGGDPAQIRMRLERSLTKLGTDRVDHYQLHRPDPDTPLAETLGCLAELQAEGKIVEIGCTHHDAEQLREAAAVAEAEGLPAYPSIQNHYSVLERGPENDGVFDACRDLDVAFVPYFPLESGLLTGKYRKGEERPADSRLAAWGERAENFIDDAKLDVVEALIAWAADHDHSLLDLAISWHTSHPLVATVISGATKPDQVRANAAAAGWQLSDAERAEVDAIVGAG